MNSEKNKDLFLKQVEQILDGIKKDKEKVGSQQCFCFILSRCFCTA